jgi:hypothetical protein
MVFGPNSSRADLIRWYFAADGAKHLEFPTPFVSRNWDQWEVWPDVGEIQFGVRPRNDGSFPIVVPGQKAPCGERTVWERGTVGTPLPIYPRNMFGIAACCGGLIAPLGEPTFGLQVQIGFSGPPVPGLEPVEVEIGKEDRQEALALTASLAGEHVYSGPFVPKLLEVLPLDDEEQQRKLIFGGKE